MIDFQSKAGAINSKDIDLSKIYATKQNALDGVNNVKITENNASWKSDDLTYVIQDDNRTVVISNGGVPIGYTTVEALNATTNPSERGFPSTRKPTTEETGQDLSNVDYQANSDDLIGDAPTPQAEPEQTIEPTYNEAPAEEIHEEHNTPIASGEEAPAPEINITINEEAAEEVKQDEVVTETPTEQVEMTSEVQDPVAEEIAAETQPTPEPPIDVESLEMEATVEDTGASTFAGGGLDPSSALYSKLGGNTTNLDLMINWLKSRGFNDAQICGIVGNSAYESGLQLEIKNPDSSAKGLFQWLSNRYPDSWDFETQMNHMLEEYGTRVSVGATVAQHYSTVTTASDAAACWAKHFEGYEGGMSVRKQYAEDCWNYIHGN